MPERNQLYTLSESEVNILATLVALRMSELTVANDNPEVVGIYKRIYRKFRGEASGM